VSPDAALSCPACGTAAAPGSRFCSSCGAGLAVGCPNCGAPASGRFCAQCGTALATDAAEPAPEPRQPASPVSERRLTSVLFADLVGFTPLSEARDPEDVREILSRYFSVARTVIGRYGGTVEKFIGDAVMAVWGVPTTREDDAERAVRAGLDLVDAIAALGDEVGAPGLSMRVGIVTGEVATTIGATGEGMVAGDSVNTAARIQSAASPGEVWVDTSTRALTSAAVAYADAGTHALKGKAEPLALFSAQHVVAAVGGAQRVDGLEAPFVGRDRDMRLVKELFHATLEEGRPRLVAVSGLPGVGKSRLGWEFFKYIDGISDLVRWHRGRCLSYGDGVAFWALAEMVRSRLDVLEGDDPIVVAQKLRTGLERWVSDPEERGWLMPRMATLLGIVDAISPGATFGREDLFSSWQLFFERLISDGAPGVALLIEDLQWADDGLLDFIDHLLANSQAAVFILTLARPELGERRSGWASGRRATPLYLEPLPDPAMGAVVDALVDGLPADIRTALVERAEGIPLYAVETVRSLIDRDAVVPFEGRYILADNAAAALGLETLAAPTSLQTLLAARLDALDPEERAAVQNAAVLGLSFSRRALEKLTGGIDAALQLDVTLASLVRKEILTLENDPRSPERGQYRFVQAMVRSVAYETVSKRDRKARHLLAAEHLAGEPDAEGFAAVLAAHLIDARAAQPDDPDADELARRAVDLLERAAQRAHALGSPAQAIKHYDLALSLVTDDESVGRLSTGAARSALTAAWTREAVTFGDAAAAAYERAGQPVEAAVGLAIGAEALLLQGEGSEIPDRLIPIYESLESVPGAAPALTQLARIIGRATFLGKSDARGSFVWWERAIELAEGEEDWPQLAAAMSSYGAALLSSGRPMMGLGMLRIALEVARTHDLAEVQGTPLNNLVSFLAGRDLVQAKEYAEEGLALTRRLGDNASGIYMVNSSILVYWLSGDWDKTMALFEEVADRAGVTVMGLAYANDIARNRGLPPRAAVGIDDDKADAPQFRTPVELLQATGLAEAGDAPGALALAAHALKIYYEFGGFDDDFPIFWTTTFELAISAGDLDEAHRIVHLVADAPRGWLSPFIRALVPYFRARTATLGGGDPALIDADFADGANALRAFGSRFWLARCLLDHCEWLGAQGRGDEVTTMLEEAELTFTSLAATPWVQRAQRARSLALR
jgi:class 3 adenylate cyclase